MSAEILIASTLSGRGRTAAFAAISRLPFSAGDTAIGFGRCFSSFTSSFYNFVVVVVG
jgi:hypothetical protein